MEKTEKASTAEGQLFRRRQAALGYAANERSFWGVISSVSPSSFW